MRDRKSSTVAWFTPFSRGSDISRFTRCLVPHMAPGKDPDWSFALFVNDNGARFGTELPALGIDSVDDAASLASFFDFPIYNVGNNTENHGKIVKTLRKVPGIVVLHDIVYQHLLAWECLERAKSPQLYARVMAEIYGVTGLDAAIRSGLVGAGPRRYSIWDSPLTEAFPLLEMILGLASGVIVHSKYAEAKVRKAFGGPILRLALPWDQKPCLSEQEISDWTSATRTTKRCVFTSFGYLSRTKNLHRAIQAFITRPELAEVARLVIVGFPGDHSYLEELKKTVRDNHLDDCVVFELSVTDQRLHQCKLEADVFINTRSPITESASGSLTEQLNSAKPAIVFAAGPYSEIPSGAVIKLAPNCSDEAFADTMLSLAKDAERRIAVGNAGLSHVRGISAADYLRQLKQFLVAEECVLKGRQRFRVPIKEGNRWSAHDAAEDGDWFAALTKCRSVWNTVDLDSACWSPAPFLEWEPRSAVRYGLAVVLGIDPAPSLEATAANVYCSIGSWEFYRLLQVMRRKLWLARLECVPTQLREQDRPIVTSTAFWRIAIYLEPLELARLCFVSLLGRVWRDGEDTMWAALFECCTNPKTIIERFLDRLDMPNGTRAADVGLMRNWCREEDKSDCELAARPSHAFQWPVGARLEFNPANTQSGALLAGQWFDPEPQGRWMGRFGAFRFEPADVGDEDLILEITCRIAASGEAGPGMLKIASSLGHLESILLEDDMRARVAVPIPAGAAGHGPVAVTFEISRTACMKALNLGGDTRDLGIMLFSATLKTRPSAAKSDAVIAELPHPDTGEDDPFLEEHSVTPFPRMRA